MWGRWLVFEEKGRVKEGDKVFHFRGKKTRVAEIVKLEKGGWKRFVVFFRGKKTRLDERGKCDPAIFSLRENGGASRVKRKGERGDRAGSGRKKKALEMLTMALKSVSSRNQRERSLGKQESEIWLGGLFLLSEKKGGGCGGQKKLTG